MATSSCCGHDRLVQSFICCCTASMYRAADRAETTVVDRLISPWTENIYRHQFVDWLCDVPLVFSREHNRNASVTVTVNTLRCCVIVSQGSVSRSRWAIHLCTFSRVAFRHWFDHFPSTTSWHIDCVHDTCNTAWPIPLCGCCRFL